MKRLLIIMLSLVTVCSCSRGVDVTKLYKQYASREDITVANVSGFHLNDTVKVDVVILVADDTAAWQGLKEEFDIRTSEGVTSWMGSVDNPRQRVKSNQRPAWRSMAVHDDRTIAFYHIADDEQYEAMLDYQMENQEK